MQVWASASVGAERRDKLLRNLAAVFPGQMEPLCQQLHGLTRKVTVLLSLGME